MKKLFTSILLFASLAVCAQQQNYLLGYCAARSQQSVVVQWVSAQDVYFIPGSGLQYQMIDRFEVEYASNGVNFLTIQTVPQDVAAIFSNIRHIYIDQQNFPAVHSGRYRIKVFRKDGQIETSSSFSVQGNVNSLTGIFNL